MATTSGKTNSQPHSLSRSSSQTRPKLLRSSVTAPTLITSYASRKDRSSPNFGTNGGNSSSRDRATMLLNRVATYSYGCAEKFEEKRRQVTNSEKRIVSSPGGRGDIGEKGGSGKSKKAKASMQVQSDGEKQGAYFSFPSFEEFEEYRESDGKDGGENVVRRSTIR